jgi:hypothetical protein
MRALAVCALTACGRLGFENPSDGGIGNGGLRSTLALDRIDPGEELVDFPLLVLLDDTRIDRTRLRSDASDLRFYDSGGSVLPHELEQIGSPGGAPLVAWVRVPTIAGLTTTLALSYGGQPPAPSTMSVWGDAYVGVWHFSEPGDPLDATVGHHDGTDIGSSPAAGMIAGGRDFPGTVGNSAVAVLDAADFDVTALTISAWIFERTMAQQYSGFVTRQQAATSENDFYVGEVNANAFGEVFTTMGPAVGFVDMPSQSPLGRWFHIALTADASVLRMYRDGVAIGLLAITGALVHSPNSIYFGADHNPAGGTGPNTDGLDGLMDEVRIERVARSPGWIAYDVASMRDQVISFRASP